MVFRREYIAYHVIVGRFSYSEIWIDKGGRHYKYKYATCVGMRESKVHNTPGVVVFLPDEVMFFPDK